MPKFIEVVVSNKDLPVGSICQVIRENRKSYRIIWRSAYGSYTYTIKKEFCKRRRRK